MKILNDGTEVVNTLVLKVVFSFPYIPLHLLLFSFFFLPYFFQIFFPLLLAFSTLFSFLPLPLQSHFLRCNPNILKW